MHLYPQRRDVAAQVAEELNTVTYATPPMEERRKKTWTEVHGRPGGLVKAGVVLIKISTVSFQESAGLK